MAQLYLTLTVAITPVLMVTAEELCIVKYQEVIVLSVSMQEDLIFLMGMMHM